MKKLLDNYPKKRPPLPKPLQNLFDEHYLKNRESSSENLIHKKIESWCHNAIPDRLLENKIPSVVYYKFPIHLMEAFRYLGYNKGYLPVSEKLSDTIVSLPMHPYLTEQDIDCILQTIQNK